jgi:ubiquinone/menaquinone biosynthesis C-methylase UbiE
MSYYDHIAKKWHSFSGAQGGAFKKYALNDLVMSRISDIAGRNILELGAGNGYFMPLVLRRFSGQVASRIVITDQSSILLNIAQRFFRVPEAEYQVLDVRMSFPFAKESFDLILANMLFNEIATRDLRQALRECHRVLSPNGRLLATLIHPTFAKSLARRGELKRYRNGVYTMPASEGLRLPVALTSLKGYQSALQDAGFRFQSQDIFGNRQVMNAKPGLRQAGKAPIALLLECEER